MDTNTRHESVTLTFGVEVVHDHDTTWNVVWDGTHLGTVYPDNDPEEWTWYARTPYYIDPESCGSFEDAVESVVEQHFIEASARAR